MSTRIVQTLTATVVGVEAVTVIVEVLTRSGGNKPICSVIGLGDTAVREARERVHGAVSSLGVFLPEKILINLFPAELRKEGSSFDLAMAAGLLMSVDLIKPELLQDVALFGELSLRGEVLPVRGALALAACAAENGAKAIIVPAANAAEAVLCCRCPVYAISYLQELYKPELLCRVPASEIGKFSADAAEKNLTQEIPTDPFSDVLGQERAKRALTIAAAGGHNVLLVGPPGCGKSMLAERMVNLLPALEMDELIETIRVHSLANQPITSLLNRIRPFRAPHYASTGPGIVGGGQPFSPGEISLAHRGVLFLDEFPEFKRAVLEALRIPLEKGRLCVSRAQGAIDLPAQFQLVAAMNPCPCGKLGSSKSCDCSVGARLNYLSRLSQPILDRIDMHVELHGVSVGELARVKNIATKDLQDRRGDVVRARHMALNERGMCNGSLSAAQLRTYAPISGEGAKLFEAAADKFGLSARGVTRVMRVARTIADLGNEPDVSTAHIAEALSYRTMERQRVK